MKKRVCISGGWGYGNIGDDAILTATVNLIHAYDNEVEVVVLSFNPHETRVLTKGLIAHDIEIQKSFHRLLVGDFYAWGVYTLKHSLRNQLLSRVVGKVGMQLKKVFGKRLKMLRNVDEGRFQELKGFDAFILAGGGYMNDNWAESFFAHLIELNGCKNQHIPMALIGLTIGPVNDKRNWKFLKGSILEKTPIAVRDEKSLQDLQENGFKAELIPDLALFDDYTHLTKVNDLTFIAGGAKKMKSADADIIAYTFKELTTEHGLRAKILTTRAWSQDRLKAETLAKSFTRFGIEHVVIYPDSLESLQNEIGISKVVVSQNLHGLVMAFRAGVPVISLNRHQKFVGFMKLIGLEENLFDSNVQAEEQNRFAHQLECCLHAQAETELKFKDIRLDLKRRSFNLLNQILPS